MSKSKQKINRKEIYIGEIRRREKESQLFQGRK